MGIKTQAATEYLMVVGFVMIILLPAIYLYTQYSRESEDSIISAKVDAITNEIVKAAEQVYSYGEGSQTTVTIDVPKNVVAINFQGNEIVFVVINSKGKQSEIAKVANVNLEGQITLVPGNKKINVRSLGDRVSVFVECSNTAERCGSDFECSYYKEGFIEGQGCILECENNKWIYDDGNFCYDGCENNECKLCTDGEKVCGSGSQCSQGGNCIMECQDDVYVPLQECIDPMPSCFLGECVECTSKEDDICGTELQCGPSYPCTMECTNYQWTLKEGCQDPLACVDGQCIIQEECNPGETKCGSELECINNPFPCVLECLEGDIWADIMTCLPDECDGGQCVPGGGGPA